MTRPMRILEVVTNFLPGGIQRHVLDLADDLRARGHAVTLAGDAGDWSETTDVVNVPLNGVSWRGGSAVARVAALWPCVRDLRRAIRLGRIELVHAHETAPAIVARLATLGLDVPVVLTFHGSAPEREASVARTARLCADLTLSPSRDGIERLVAHGLPRTRAQATGLGIAPMPAVDPAEAAALRAALLDGREGPLILSLSRIDRQKGIDVMVDVAARVTARAPGATFVVAGKGPMEHKVAGWAEAAGVTDAMRFVGPTDQVPLYLAAADLFLLTSRWENLPISIVEAFRAGLPVVATDCGGVRELVDDSVGALVPVEDPATSAAALLRLIDDSEARARAGANALARSTEDRFTPAAVHARFETLYAELLARR
ncbi:MAG: glycosyltransferase family 4 protein [Roseivivax sp.]|nr:glycosyltransferase family 4 protein [Roseivivax sp.]